MGDDERIDAMEDEIEKIKKRVDDLDRNSKKIQWEIGEMKERVLSIESNMRELVEIFKILSKKLEDKKRMGDGG